MCEVAGTCVRETVSTFWFCLVEGDGVQPPDLVADAATGGWGEGGGGAEYRWRFLPEATPAGSISARWGRGGGTIAGGIEGQEEGRRGMEGERVGVVQRTGTLRKTGRGGWVLAGIHSEKSS